MRSRAVTMPRQILPSSAYLATRRTTQRQFLLKPDQRTNNDLIYCIAVCAERHGIQIIDFKALSDHLHQVFFALRRNAPAYLRDVNGLIAKVFNARFGRWENLWASGQGSLVRLETIEALIEEIVYVATNAVKHGLVEHAYEWPGARGFEALVSGRPLKAKRPASFLSKRNKSWPDKVKLFLKIPPELGDHDAIIRAVLPRVAAAERQYRHEWNLAGKSFLGRYAVLRASREDHAKTRAVRRGLNPTIATKNTPVRLAAIERKRDFQKAYRKALLAYRAGAPIPFPAGTYWLALHLNVPVEPFENLA